MPRIRVVALALTMTVLGFSAAQAQSNYIAFHGGYVLTEDPDLTTFVGDIPHTQEPGYAVGVALGHETGVGIRMELEATYRVNAIDSVGGVSATGDIVTGAFMGNLYFDSAEYREPSPFARTTLVPYIGFGAGAVYMDFQDVEVGGALWVDDGNWEPAVQGILGVGVRLKSGSVISIDYRYFKTFAGDFQPEAGLAFDAEYVLHTAMLSLRASF